ncbi:general substrate transporter [Aaosphaeria arxii CBS 175.79]|uniref:General substrate transporter n=1 Tax=Aaosphaeria arxii CBS 175.79 TaxID=1450172 RepID=A0A6A5X9Y8_9PLEO|nr:general substrate transporter [Aaosphaeria arxii CBS 175.79]KAF2009761.1 general substrate transporter [Aaosphaeria arxii CBS 175.79]
MSGKTVYNVYTICSFAALGGALFGFDISSMSGVLGTNGYKNYFGNPTGYRQGGITASMPAGSLVGALSSSFIADRLSRRTAIQIAAAIWCIGAIFQTAANGIPLLCIGRVVAGYSIGIASAVVPIYQSEIAPKEIRGRVVSLQQWAITWGILIQYFIQYGSSFVDGGPKDPNQGTASFRIPWAMQLIPGVILFCGMFFFPYSPRWLASKDRWEEAATVLAGLHGGGDVNHPKVLAEYREIEDALRFEREEAVTSFKALAEPRILKRVLLGMSLQMWSQLCGMNIMMYYIVYIMKGAGIGDELLTASIQYIINVALTLPAIIWIDRIGRRPAMLFGFFGMMVFLFISGALQATAGRPNPNPDDKDISWVILGNPAASRGVVACSYLFVATFATSIGPTSWVYPSELNNTKVRAKAVSLATATNWTWNTALAFAVPPLLWSINWKMYMIFAAFNGAALVHMFLLAPETKGKTLEEMDEVFDSGRPAWKSVPKGSRLDNLAVDIEKGEVKVKTAASGRDGGATAATATESTTHTETPKA